MPTYEYVCEATGHRLEVRHGFSECVETWGELCKLAGADPGLTPLDIPVSRVFSGGLMIRTAKRGAQPQQAASLAGAHRHGPDCSCCSPPWLRSRDTDADPGS